MTDEEIMNELKLNFKISNFGTITIENGLVSCGGDVLLLAAENFTIPAKFLSVSGNFHCGGNPLSSLAGVPQTVGGDFDCSYTYLKSLADAPQTVGGGFYCNHNQLTSLAGAPQSVGGSFNCYNNQLTSLRGAPRYVAKSFRCTHNPLASLAGAPQYVGEAFELTYTKNLALLPLLMIKGCQQVKFFPRTDYNFEKNLPDILNRYLGTGTQGMLPCADEMIEAGYGSNAHYD